MTGVPDLLGLALALWAPWWPQPRRASREGAGQGCGALDAANVLAVGTASREGRPPAKAGVSGKRGGSRTSPLRDLSQPGPSRVIQPASPAGIGTSAGARHLRLVGGTDG
jgi:hypothetical protein